MLGEGWAFLPEAGEDEAPIARYPRCWPESVRALVEGGIAARVGHAEQRTVEVVGPAVIRTGERSGVTAFEGAHHRTPVRAPVDEDGDAAVLTAHHDDGLGAEKTGDEVARARDFAVVTDEDPSSMEDPLHLVGEDTWIGIEGRVDAVVLHQPLVIDDGRRGRRGGVHATKPQA
jgi:hypothetical protein